jgi:hypothetical protein
MAGLPAEDVAMTQAQYALPPPHPTQPTQPTLPAQQFPAPILIASPTLQEPSSPQKGLVRMLSKLKRKDSQQLRISPPLQSLNEFEKLDISKHKAPIQNSQQVYPPSPPHGSQSSGTSPPQSGHGRSVSTATLQSQGMEQPLAAVALHFICRLEAVCLDHMHAAHEADQDPESAPHGHALMGTALQYAYSSPSFSSTPNSQYSSSAGSAVSPGSGLDQRTLEVLLNLNFQTNNGDYINTMGGQIFGTISVLDAWNLICAHKKFGKFDLEAVATRLVPKVDCRGYGPTIDAEEVFKAIDEISSGTVYRRI